MWKVPPISKIYEALGAVVDDRLEISGATAKCYSSSGNKFYDISYDAEQNAIMVNDNGSYWRGYLGYPAVAFLLQTSVLEYNKELAIYFKGITWKDLNQEFKNDFNKTVEFVLKDVDSGKKAEIEAYAARLLNDIEGLKLSKLGKMQKPPAGY